MSAAFDKAARALNQQDYKAAEFGFTQVLKDEPENAAAMINLLLARVRRRRQFRSLKLMKRALALGPKNIEILRTSAVIHYVRQEIRPGIAVLKQARAIEPHDSQTHALLAAGYLDQRKKAECEAALKEALRLQPSNSTALYVKGRLETIFYDVKAAEVTAKIRLRKSPESPNAHLQAGRVSLAKGDVPQAYWHAREALRLSPNSPEARMALATALIQRFRPYNWLHRVGLRLKRYRFLGSFVFYYLLLQVVVRLSSSQHVPPAVRAWTVGFCIATGCLLAALVFPMPFVTFAMRFHPVGRYAMSTLDKLESVFAGLVFVVGIGCLCVGPFWQLAHLLRAAAVCGVTFLFIGLWAALVRWSSVRWFALSATMFAWGALLMAALFAD